MITKGKWTVRHEPHGSSVEGPNGEGIAWCGAHLDGDTHKSNAALMAVAPELLEVVLAFLSLPARKYDIAHIKIGGGTNSVCDGALLLRALAVYASATGDNPYALIPGQNITAPPKLDANGWRRSAAKAGHTTIRDELEAELGGGDHDPWSGDP